MRKFIIFIILIVSFVLGIGVGLLWDNMSVIKSNGCLLSITSKWDSYVGVAGNELNGGEKSMCFKTLRAGDFIDYAYNKNGKSDIIYIKIKKMLK